MRRCRSTVGEPDADDAAATGTSGNTGTGRGAGAGMGAGTGLGSFFHHHGRRASIAICIGAFQICHAGATVALGSG